MAVLVCGGAGYIGTHTLVELIQAGEKVVVVDDLSNSKFEAILRVEKLTNSKIKFYELNICDTEKLERVFKDNEIDSVIHFAAKKAVGESVEKPLEYYENNLNCTFSLAKLMKKYNVKNIVFSSSATVYGSPKEVPIFENFSLWCSNPYGWTKLMNEQILRDIAFVEKDWNVALLRYFNPIGAHESGEIGEDPNGILNNLMPYITQVAVGKLEKLCIYGDDYNTVDGTGVRDYIHVCDLAHGHLLALNKLRKNSGLVTYNLGTGNGNSVLEMVKAFEKANNVKIPYEIVERRPGDIETCFANCDLAFRELGFNAQFDIDRMCKDSFRWQQKNPNGF